MDEKRVERINRMEKDIKKWEAEMNANAVRQKELTERHNEKQKELRRKIQETRQQITEEENQLIARMVRELCGEVRVEKMGNLKEYLQLYAEENQEAGREQETEDTPFQD